MYKSIDKLAQEYAFKHEWGYRTTMLSRTTVLYMYYRDKTTKNSSLKNIGRKLKRIVMGGGPR